MVSLPKTMKSNRKMRTFGDPKNMYRSKGFDESYQKIDIDKIVVCRKDQ